MLSETALMIVDKLKDEEKILITKAISWLLRSMVKYNRDAVEAYIKHHASSLPRIALRETLVKLETGKKTIKVQ
jgi:3-methyladenine DNA glycosylase AlkD